MPRAPSNGRSSEKAPSRRRTSARRAGGSGGQRAPTESSDDEIYLRKRTRRLILSPDTTSSSGASTPKTTPQTTPQKPTANGTANGIADGVANGVSPAGQNGGPSATTQGSDNSPGRIATPATPAKGNRPSLRTLADLGLEDREAPPCPNYSGYSTLCLKDGQIEWERAYSLSPQHRPFIERMVSWFNSEDMTRDGISQVMRNDPDYRELFRRYRGLLGVRIGLLRQEFLPDAEGYEIVHVGPASNGATMTNGPSSSSAPAAAQATLRNGSQGGNAFLVASS
ncbi:hypothetical protein A1Q1_05371 [Trichosporon asahii var. asahii CBS 2479]|uniref:Uncharacterized protein n=1 Tax=Trichosporon asahii var. asahii (strain ATCC 90039 / CBS 2479 / JCM 2466 / KCTC 7840 / NBRC 103889/ NCYC 2677 / UAMH 7654) TaxID=1186058 RepID=J4U7A7_TRIAS|nr:hypothetical protein A1Q1_05371 [Trichosporon asahii var. asahii CBS 2479]EJT46160.1 hypothetical protein A1Q1_05371 [Trichosporon asahii var. asahii CBS 2479]